MLRTILVPAPRKKGGQEQAGKPEYAVRPANLQLGVARGVKEKASQTAQNHEDAQTRAHPTRAAHRLKEEGKSGQSNEHEADRPHPTGQARLVAAQRQRRHLARRMPFR